MAISSPSTQLAASDLIKSPAAVIQVGDTSLDTLTRAVSHNGRQVKLTPICFRILWHLMAAKRVVAFEALVRLVWGHTRSFDSQKLTLRVHIRSLRKALGSSDHEGPIYTIRGLGYVFRASKE